MSETLKMIYELAKEGYDFTLNRNAGVYDDEKCWVRFHCMGHYGISEGKTDIDEAVKEAYGIIRSTPRPTIPKV